MKDHIRLTKIIVDMLDQCTKEELNDLLNKRAKLRIEYPRTSDVIKIPVANVDEIVKNLDSFQSREEAEVYLKGLNATKAFLRDIIQHYDIPVKSKDTVAQMIDSIIEGSVLRSV